MKGLIFAILKLLDPAGNLKNFRLCNADCNRPHWLIAMRAIAAGEEVCFDYVMCDGSSYDEFECSCGSARGRGRPKLWERYDGYFMPYLGRRIAALKKEKHHQHKKAAA